MSDSDYGFDDDASMYENSSDGGYSDDQGGYSDDGGLEYSDGEASSPLAKGTKVGGVPSRRGGRPGQPGCPPPPPPPLKQRRQRRCRSGPLRPQPACAPCLPVCAPQKTFMVLDKDELRDRLKAEVAQVGTRTRAAHPHPVAFHAVLPPAFSSLCNDAS